MQLVGIRHCACVVAFAALSTITAEAGFVETKLISDVPGIGSQPNDPQLKNPWGISFAPGGPFWVSEQVTGVSTLYNGVGAKQGLVVTIPPAPGSPAGTVGTPTGQVFNGTADFGGTHFIFATLDGTIAGWKTGTHAASEITVANASYTGLANGNDGARNLLYAANAKGGIDVFDKNFALTTVTGGFVDPNGLPSGYTAFNVQNLGGHLFVTFANQATSGGIVDEFDTSGHFIRRIATNAPGGALDQPWGLTLAPAGFGNFGGDLLVGNNDGDFKINAYKLDGTADGSLILDTGQPFSEDGLWGLTFGGGGKGGDPNTLYFAAGINGEQDGLFGEIQFTPEPHTLVSLGIGGALVIASMLRRRFRRSVGTA